MSTGTPCTPWSARTASQSTAISPEPPEFPAVTNVTWAGAGLDARVVVGAAWSCWTTRQRSMSASAEPPSSRTWQGSIRAASNTSPLTTGLAGPTTAWWRWWDPPPCHRCCRQPARWRRDRRRPTNRSELHGPIVGLDPTVRQSRWSRPLRPARHQNPAYALLDSRRRDETRRPSPRRRSGSAATTSTSDAGRAGADGLTVLAAPAWCSRRPRPMTGVRREETRWQRASSTCPPR